jgi:short-subunit dehydrogenase
MSSVSAMRGMPSAMTTYGATKAGVAALTEGIRSDVIGKPIRVTTLFPGYIRSEMNERVAHKIRFMIDTETGCRALVNAIEKEGAEYVIPPWPWKTLGFVMRHVPLKYVRKLIAS